MSNHLVWCIPYMILQNSIVIEEVNLMDNAEWFGLKKIETDNISIAHYVWVRI